MAVQAVALGSSIQDLMGSQVVESHCASHVVESHLVASTEGSGSGAEGSNKLLAVVRNLAVYSPGSC